MQLVVASALLCEFGTADGSAEQSCMQEVMHG